MATQPDDTKPTIVLVHGAWADATGFGGCPESRRTSMAARCASGSGRPPLHGGIGQVSRLPDDFARA
jgi:hypothetical protein